MWLIIGQKGLEASARLTQVNDFRVLFSALATMDDSNLINNTQISIARALDIANEDVSVSYDRLRKSEVIIKSEEGSERFYLNPELFWRGSRSERLEAFLALRDSRKAPQQSAKEKSPAKKRKSKSQNNVEK